ncbi:cysteine hydrolase family protein [Mycolicibacterium hodleri]|uniref:cysteine hydrolase family protein n=1 Tax=Mycolicibacterium hodleri TaxID=49897 RepID=UPI0021F397FA|nr:isochorismatase family cysteine hydrolase [Mycolicibacterium hodleri]
MAIDLQEVFRQPASEWFTPRYEDAAAGTRELLPLFGPRAVFTRFIAPAHPTGAWVDYYEKWPFAMVPANDRLYDLTAEFNPVHHAVVSLTTLGKWGPDLAAAMNGSREMVLTGVATDCCVLSTALAAADAGVHVQVVADACAGASDRDHRRALEAMELYAPLIDVTTVERVQRLLASRRRL